MTSVTALSITQVKDYIKRFKKLNCPPTSNLSNAELRGLARKLGLRQSGQGTTTNPQQPDMSQPARPRATRKKKQTEEKKEYSIEDETDEALKKKYDKIVKETADMRDEAGKIVERKGKETKESKDLIKKVKELSLERFMISKEINRRKKEKAGAKPTPKPKEEEMAGGKPETPETGIKGKVRQSKNKPPEKIIRSETKKSQKSIMGTLKKKAPKRKAPSRPEEEKAGGKPDTPPLPKSKKPKGHIVDGKFYPYPTEKAPSAPQTQTPWIKHVKAIRSKNPSMSWKDALREGSKTYKK